MSSSPPELRVPTLDDVSDLARLAATLAERYGEGAPSEAEFRERLTSPFIDPQDDLRIAERDGRILGWAAIWRPREDSERIFVDISAHPREREIYEPLLDWTEGQAARSGRPLLQTGVDAENAVFADEVRRRRFELIRHFFRMEIDLADESPEPAWPEGIRVRTLEPGDERKVWEADQEAFLDHWEPIDISFEEFESHFLKSEAHDPTLWFLACDGDEIAGFALCQSERRPQTGHVGILGVRRAWRRRGIARALLLHAFREFRRRGRRRVDLGVDAENPTGALGLYEQAGMHVAKRTDVYRKSFAA